MQAQSLTVGVNPVAVPLTLPLPLKLGMKILGRNANTGVVYLGTVSNVTTSNGHIIPKGDPATSIPFTVPPEHFNPMAGGTATIYLVASAADQIVDWSAE